jgi:hypothetical protein
MRNSTDAVAPFTSASRPDYAYASVPFLQARSTSGASKIATEPKWITFASMTVFQYMPFQIPRHAKCAMTWIKLSRLGDEP